MSIRNHFILCLVVLSSFIQVQASDSFLQLLGNEAGGTTVSIKGTYGGQSLTSLYDNGLQSTWLIRMPNSGQAAPIITACCFVSSGQNIVMPVGSNDSQFISASEEGGRIYFLGVTRWGTIQGHPVVKDNEGHFLVNPEMPSSPGNFESMKSIDRNSFWVMVIPGFGKERMTPPIEGAQLISYGETVDVKTTDENLAPIFTNRMRPCWQAYVFAVDKEGRIAVVPTYVKEETDSDITFAAPKPSDFF